MYVSNQLILWGGLQMFVYTHFISINWNFSVEHKLHFVNNLHSSIHVYSIDPLHPPTHTYTLNYSNVTSPPSISAGYCLKTNLFLLQSNYYHIVGCLIEIQAEQFPQSSPLSLSEFSNIWCLI